MRRITLLLFLLVSVGASAAEVYRWVDDNGEVHYSDRPQEGAEIISIPNAQSFSTPRQSGTQRKKSSTATDKAGDEQALFKYQSFRIVSPAAAEVFWNIGGNLTIELNSQPGIQRSHTIFLYLDGQEVQRIDGGQTRITLSDVYRGEHTLQAVVKDDSGNSLAKTDVTFTVQQTSIQSQNNRSIGRAGAPLPARG